MHDKLKHPLAVLADRIATEAHEGQLRKWCAVPYVTHPRRVAALVAGLDGTNEVDVAAALLHDVVEDTPGDGGGADDPAGQRRHRAGRGGRGGRPGAGVDQ